MAIGAGFVAGAIGLVLIHAPASTVGGFVLLGLGFTVGAVLGTRELSRPTPDVIQVRTITGSRQTPLVEASLVLTMYGAANVQLEAVTKSGSTELIGWVKPLSLSRTVQLSERIGHALELAVRVDPRITESVSHQRGHFGSPACCSRSSS